MEKLLFQLWTGRKQFAKQSLHFFSAGHEAVAKKQWWFYFHEYIFHYVWARSLITLDLANVFETEFKMLFLHGGVLLTSEP